MKIKPLIQLREMISKALSGQTNLHKILRFYASWIKIKTAVLIFKAKKADVASLPTAQVIKV